MSKHTKESTPVVKAEKKDMNEAAKKDIATDTAVNKSAKKPRRNVSRGKYQILKVKSKVSLTAHSVRTVTVNSPALLTNLADEIETVNLTNYRLTRTFSAYASKSSLKKYQDYFNDTLSLLDSLIEDELARNTHILKQYQAKGYAFNFAGTPAEIEYKITRSEVDQLLDIYLKLDKLLTCATWLEKTNYWDMIELRDYQNSWLSVMTNFKKSLRSLSDKLQRQFKLKVQVRGERPDRSAVDFGKLNEFLFNARRDYLDALRTASPTKDNAA